MTKIPVKIHENEFVSTNGYDWECQHVTTYGDAIEHCDYYQEAVTGVPQPVYTETIQVCEDCDAYYSQRDEDWHDE